MPVTVEPVADEEPPAELIDFELWCAERGVPFHLVSDKNTLSEFADRQAAFRAWCAERERFAARHGWTRGEPVRRREEVSVEPFDLNAI